MIDMLTVNTIEKLEMPYNYQHTALVQLGDNIYSALSLGFMDALKVEMDWIIGLMKQHYVDPTMLKPLIVAYVQAVEKAMGPSGQDITDWLMKNAGV
jgi:hypothetical protein